MKYEQKITAAMERIEDLYIKTGGMCYISFSGGKDSTILLAITKMCAEINTIPTEGIKAVFSDTGIELDVTKKFVMWCKENWYQNIEIIHPEKSFGWVMENKGKPIRSKVKSEFIGRWQKGNHSDCTRRNLIEGKTASGKMATRTKLADKDMHMIHPDFDIKASPLCCSFLKKKPFRKYEKENGIKGYATGIRMGEGGVRVLNRLNDQDGKICESFSNGKFVKYPLIDWTDEDIERFIEENNIPISDAYTKYGFSRTGCMACPFAPDVEKDLKYLHDFEPLKYKASMFWLKDVYIAQNVIIPFDQEYEKERVKKWRDCYEPMRQEMLRKCRPNSKLIKDGDFTTIFDFMEVSR